MASRLCPFCMRMTEDDTCHHCGNVTNYSGQPLHLPAGYVVSGRHPYVLGAALGQGGFGITYIALDMVTRERVAIKEYFPTYCSGRTGNHTVTAYQSQDDIYLKGRERFLDEAKTLKSLSDLKSIVNVLDFFQANNTAYLVMEYLDGSSLKEHAAKNGKFPAQKFLEQIKPLMEDIQKMHDRGVIHRDIAPDNIILLPDGQMKLIDFGAARSYLGDKSMTVVVKKGFAPAEQYFSTGSTASSDVYSLAATIYYCITGTVPMDSAQRQMSSLPLEIPTALGAEITSAQEHALLRALETQQKCRTQSIQELIDRLYGPAESDSTEPEEKSLPEVQHPIAEKPEPIPSVPEKENRPADRLPAGGRNTGKKTIPWKLIIPGIAAVLILVCVILFTPISNNGKYLRAQKYLSQNQFPEASQMFAELGDYKDSRDLWEQAVYADAEQLLSEKKFEDVLERVARIPNYEKASDLKSECLYQRGSLSLDKKEYAAAYADFSQIPGNYKQVSATLHQIKLDWGRRIIDRSDLSDAQKYEKSVDLTEAESKELYNYINNKNFYASVTGISSSSDFKTRRTMMNALVGDFPLKPDLCKLYEEFSAANASNFIKKNHELIANLWDVPVMQNIISEDWNFCIWLLGKWKAKSGLSVEFYEKEGDTSIWSTISLPWVKKPSGTAYWNIVNKEYIWADKNDKELAKVYRFTFLGPDSMDVYCFKNDRTYTVTRVP